ncbi:uncharacterized protein LOC116347769 [Contarinia nasturtii]|uniref:uncharacterized protein LOC116347769 n=1 Tax=Contarinia nasturtii TaxID=265458 RepID=UPI0012D48A69|nr:uncharacterized protein LOC116347769 [Contarinia nasturtii]
MSTDDWTQELDKMLMNIELQAMSSLRNISNCFEQSGQSFHEAHQTYCLKRSIDRLNEVYSKFECELSFSNRQRGSVAPISTDNNNSNAIIKISNDEDSDERPSTSSQPSRETAFRNVDSEIKTEDDYNESDDQAFVGGIPNVETKEEDMESDEIPIVRVSANQLTRAYKIESNCSERVKIESDEDHNKENIENVAKRVRSNSANILDKIGDNNETNLCEPYGKKSGVSQGRVESKDASCEISEENNANKTNEVNISKAAVEMNLARKLWPDCDEVLINITFNGRKIANCSEIFKREIVYFEGVCFMANSIYFYDLDWEKLPLTFYKDGAKLSFEVIQHWGYRYTVSVHSPDEFPNVLMKSILRFELYKEQKWDVRVMTTQVKNSEDVRDVSFETRNCLFSDERWPDDASLPYSTVSCWIYLRVYFELELCNCTLHFAPIEYKDYYCNYTQMECTKGYFMGLLANEYHDEVEPCPQTCTEMHIDLVGYNNHYRTEPYTQFNESDPVIAISPFSIEVINKPKVIMREVSFSDLDLVVTIGSIIGLFFAASFLSVVETIYIWILRKF